MARHSVPQCIWPPLPPQHTYMRTARMIFDSLYYVHGVSIDILVAHLCVNLNLFMLCMSNSFIKLSRPWNMQVVQQSQLVLSMSKGQSILCYSKGLIAPRIIWKTAVWNAILPHYQNSPAIPYFITIHNGAYNTSLKSQRHFIKSSQNQPLQH